MIFQYVIERTTSDRWWFIFECSYADLQSVIYDAQEKPPWGMQDPPEEAGPNASMLQANVDIFRDTLSLSQFGQFTGLSRSALDRNSLNTIPQSSQLYSNNGILSFFLFVIYDYTFSLCPLHHFG